MLEMASKGVVKTVLLEDDRNGTTICLCGVLARGNEQFDPILPALPGNVVTFHTSGRRHHADNLIEDVVRYVKLHRSNGPIRFVGASMGGMEVPFVIGRLREQVDIDPDSLQVIIIDAPSGLESLVNPQAKFMKSGFVAGAATMVPSFIKVPVNEDGLPHWDDITVPQQFMTSEAVAQDYKTWVRAEAKRCLSGYPLGQLASQTHWMIEVGADGSLAHAVSALHDVWTIYVRCTRSNDVVSDEGVYAWKRWLPSLQIESISATHCGFLQNKPEFLYLLPQIIAR